MSWLAKLFVWSVVVPTLLAGDFEHAAGIGFGAVFARLLLPSWWDRV